MNYHYHYHYVARTVVQTNTYLFAKLFELYAELHNFDFLITDLLLIT